MKKIIVKIESSSPLPRFWHAITKDIQLVTTGSYSTSKKAETGNDVVKKAVDEIQEISDRVTEAAEVVNNLGIKLLLYSFLSHSPLSEGSFLILSESYYTCEKV